MPIVHHDVLRGLIERLLLGAGAKADEAPIIARHSVAANLAGHDSHGVIMIPTYIGRVDNGDIVPGAPWEIRQETATSTVVDGNWGWGYVVSERATKMTIEKAKTSQVAATTIVQQSHIGRVAAYPLMAAREGMIAIMTADSGRGPKAVAPFGGREPRLGTNPICIAVPSAKGEAMVVDMATSAVAAGKVNLAKAKDVAIPEGWIVDGEGRPTTDPHQFGKGAVMRMGDVSAVGEADAVSTGSLGLDIALGIGGLPRGRVIEIYIVPQLVPHARQRGQVGLFLV